MKKRFIVRKYIMAENAKQALRLDLVTVAHECWIDEEWKKNNPEFEGTPIGFHTHQARKIFHKSSSSSKRIPSRASTRRSGSK